MQVKKAKVKKTSLPHESLTLKKKEKKKEIKKEGFLLR